MRGSPAARKRAARRVLLGTAAQLGDSFGCWLMQMPPSLAFDHEVAQAFFTALREHTQLPVACEARHPSWFTTEAASLLKSKHIAYVDADPIPDDCEIKHRADTSLVYVRLHGSPEMYKSSYDYTYLDDVAHTLQQRAKKGAQVWCIFDNTAEGAAQPNALRVMEAGVRVNTRPKNLPPGAAIARSFTRPTPTRRTRKPMRLSAK